MDAYEIAKEYAEVLIELGEERGILERLEEELESFYKLFQEVREFRIFLEAPHIPPREKKELLKKVFSEKWSQIFLRFLYVIADRGRFLIFWEIHRVFFEILDRKLGRLRALVKSARELPEDLKGEIQKALEEKTGKKVVTRFEVDPKLLGGFVIQMDGWQMDASLRTKLHHIRQRLSQKAQVVESS